MSHSCDETYKVYRTSIVCARRQYECCACCEPILVGHRYAYVFIVFEGTRTYRRCLRCQTIFAALVDELRKSDEWPDEDLNCGHTWGDANDTECSLQQEPPEAIAALAFLTPDEVQALDPKVDV